MNKIFIGNMFPREDGTLLVGLIHFKPFDEQHGMSMTEAELLEIGLLVDETEIPKSSPQVGMLERLIYDPQARVFSYIYENAADAGDFDPYQRTEALKQQVVLLQNALDEIILGGGF